MNYDPLTPPALAVSVLLLVIKDSPQPHCPLEFGLMNMNSDLLRESKSDVKGSERSIKTHKLEKQNPREMIFYLNQVVKILSL